MTGRTHDLAAMTLLGAVVALHPPGTITLSTALIAFLANQIGGIFPDIDQPTAPFWRNLPIGGMFGRTIGKLLGGHRFLTHSLIGLFLGGLGFKLLLEFIQPLLHHTDIGLVWWAFMIGFLSHLIMDSLTKEGVPWLLPIPIKFGFPPLRILRVTTGKKMEGFVIFPGLVLLNVLIYMNNYQEIQAFIHRHIVQ